MTTGKQTIVEAGTELRGTIASTCAVVVHGRVEGEIDAPELLISNNGAVRGRVRVGSLRSEGEISGEFEAETLELAGRVQDNTVIRAKRMDVKLASEEGKYQVIFGECDLAVGEAPVDESGAKRPRSARGKRDGRSEPPSPRDEEPTPEGTA